MLPPGADGSACSSPSSASFAGHLPDPGDRSHRCPCLHHPCARPSLLSLSVRALAPPAHPDLVGGQISLRVKVLISFFLDKDSTGPSPPVSSWLLPLPPRCFGDRCPPRGGRTTGSQLPVFALELMFSSGPVPSPQTWSSASWACCWRLAAGCWRLAAGVGAQGPQGRISSPSSPRAHPCSSPAQAHSPPRWARGYAHVFVGSPCEDQPCGPGPGWRGQGIAEFSCGC